MDLAQLLQQGRANMNNSHEIATNNHAQGPSTRTVVSFTAPVSSLDGIATQATLSDSTEILLEPVGLQELPDAPAQLPAEPESPIPQGAFIDIFNVKSLHNSQRDHSANLLRLAVPQQVATPHRNNANGRLFNPTTPPNSSQKGASTVPRQGLVIGLHQDVFRASDRLATTLQESNRSGSPRNVHQEPHTPANSIRRSCPSLQRAQDDRFHKQSPTPVRTHRQVTNGLEAAATRLCERVQGESSPDNGKTPLKRITFWEHPDARPMENSLGAASSSYHELRSPNRQDKQSQNHIPEEKLGLSPDETRGGIYARNRDDAGSRELRNSSDEEVVAERRIALSLGPGEVNAAVILSQIEQEDQRLLVEEFFKESKGQHHCQHHYCITDILSSPDSTGGNFSGCPTDCGNFNKEASIPDEEQYQAWYSMMDGNPPEMGKMPDPSTRGKWTGPVGRGKCGKANRNTYQGPSEYLTDPNRQDIYAYADNWETDPVSGERRWIGTKSLPVNPFLGRNWPDDFSKDRHYDEEWQRENMKRHDGVAKDEDPEAQQPPEKKMKKLSKKAESELKKKLEAGYQKLYADADKSLDDLDEEANRMTAEAVQLMLRHDVDFDAIRREALEGRSDSKHEKMVDSLKAKLSLSKREIDRVEEEIIKDTTVLINRESKRGTHVRPEVRDFAKEKAVKLMQCAVWALYSTGKEVALEYFQTPLELDGFARTRDLVRGLLRLQKRLCAVPESLDSAEILIEGRVKGKAQSLERTEKLSAVEKNGNGKRTRQSSNGSERSKSSRLSRSSEEKAVKNLQSELGEHWQMPTGERKKRSPRGSGGSDGS